MSRRSLSTRQKTTGLALPGFYLGNFWTYELINHYIPKYRLLYSWDINETLLNVLNLCSIVPSNSPICVMQIKKPVSSGKNMIFRPFILHSIMGLLLGTIEHRFSAFINDSLLPHEWESLYRVGC